MARKGELNMSRNGAFLAIAFCLALLLPASSQAKVVTYWYQPHYMAKVEYASNRLQFLSAHFAPGNSWGYVTPSSTSFTLDKASENPLGLNLYFTESGETEKCTGLLSPPVKVPYKKQDVVSIVYSDILFFELRNITNETGPAPWCVIPFAPSASENILCVPTRENAEQVIDALATLMAANGNTMKVPFGMALKQRSEKELRKHPEETGCEVLQVDEDGPPSQAGVLEGDTLHMVNGAVCTPDSVRAGIAEASEKPDGGVLHAEILRKGNSMQLDLHYPHVAVDAAALRQQIAALSEPNAAQPGAAASGGVAPLRGGFHLGINVRAVVDSDVAALGLPKAMGLLVTKVEKGSIADDMQLQVGDVILKANGTDVGDVDAFGQLVRSGAVKSFHVWRKGQILDLAVSQSM